MSPEFGPALLKLGADTLNLVFIDEIIHVVPISVCVAVVGESVCC